MLHNFETIFRPEAAKTQDTALGIDLHAVRHACVLFRRHVGKERPLPTMPLSAMPYAIHILFFSSEFPL